VTGVRRDELEQRRLARADTTMVRVYSIAVLRELVDAVEATVGCFCPMAT
jgi:hypothetical protein